MDGDLAEGRLVELLPDHRPPSLLLHVLTLPNGPAIPKVRSFIDILLAGLTVTDRRCSRS